MQGLESGSACLPTAMRMRQAPPNQVRFRVPNLIRATEDALLIAQDDLREPDSSVTGCSAQTHEPGSPYSGEPGSFPHEGPVARALGKSLVVEKLVATALDVRLDVVPRVVAFVVRVPSLLDVSLDVLARLVSILDLLDELLALLIRHLRCLLLDTRGFAEVDHMTCALTEIFHPHLKNTSRAAKLLRCVAA
jgi:hypothetical protein